MEDPRIALTQKSIRDHQSEIWLPNKLPNRSVPIDSWIKVLRSRTRRSVPIRAQVAKHNAKKIITARCVRLLPTDDQKSVIQEWLDCCTLMYNVAIDSINGFVEIENMRPVFYAIRKDVKQETDFIVEDSKLHRGKQSIPVHILNQSVAMAVSAYKSCESNLAKGHIQGYQLRHLRDDRLNKVMRIEKGMLKKGVCFTKLGAMKAVSQERTRAWTKEELHAVKKDRKEKGLPRAMSAEERKKMSQRSRKYHSFDFSTIASDSILKYDADTDEYMLFVPRTTLPIPIEGRRELVSLDPGLRTLFTGISENETIAIGDNAMDYISKHQKRLKKLARIKKGKRRRKMIKIEKRKMRNRIDDMHWKVANYLTSKYDNIIIGDMSIASIILKKNGLNRRLKNRIAILRYATLRERLAQKCASRCVNYRIVDESYTSRSCTKCGHLCAKTSDKLFECSSSTCDLKIDRDINGARNIYLKHLE